MAVAFILATLEKKLHKVTPSWLDNLTTPLVSIIVTSFFSFIFVGPVLREAGNLLASGITWVYHTLGFVGGGLFGLIYAPITLTGMHHSFIAIETQLIAEKAITGGSFIFSTASMNNVAQGAAVLAVLVMTKNEKVKSICSASGVSALLGITEPAMFGVTLKFKYPFYAAIIGSAVGSAYLAGTKTLAQALGAAGLPGFISMESSHYLDFAIGILLSMAVSFLLTIIFWKKFNFEGEQPKKSIDTLKNIQEEKRASLSNTDKDDKKANDKTELDAKAKHQESELTLFSPLKGTVLPIEDSNDPMFASKAMGTGVAITPIDGTLVAPCDGKINLIFPTKHAIGLTSKEGVELLIHVGINTVQMEGEGFETLVNVGDSVSKGQPLLNFDLDIIKKHGYDSQTMLLLPETDENKVIIHTSQAATDTTPILTIHP